MKSTDNKPVALVTGSTSGIGLAIAKALAKENYDLQLHGLVDPNQAQSLALFFESEFGTRLQISSLNLENPRCGSELVNLTVEHFGKIDVLINNAGVQFTAPVEEFPMEQWNRILNINLTSAFCTSQAAIPHMRKNKFGRIINIASVHGLVASINKSAYVAAKHGLIGLSKVIALENVKTGITCNSICPGWVRTPLVEKQIEQKASIENLSTFEAGVRLLGEKQPNQTFINPEDLAALVVFLASHHGVSITGSSFVMDGGWTAQ